MKVKYFRWLLLFLVIFFPLLGQTESMTQKKTESIARLDDFDQSLTLSQRKILKSTAPDQTELLTPSLRKLFIQREKLKKERTFWQNACDLKKSLAPKTPLQERESEKLAILATQGFHDLKEKYRMIRPAGLHNIFVNSGLKEEGLCWHWARDFQKRLQKLNLQSYDILWATAHAGKLREHNSVVIVSKGGSLEEGLVLDGWRHSGEPFWTLVAGDEYPWKPGEYFGEEGESP